MTRVHAVLFFFFFKQKTAYEMRISDWSSDVCSSDLLAPDGDIKAVTPVIGEPGAEPNIAILLPEGSVPWSGHSGSYAAPQVIAEIARHKTALVFCNTRGLAELTFQQLWAVNNDNLPIGIHHGSLSREARRKVEAAMAAGKLRG